MDLREWEKQSAKIIYMFCIWHRPDYSLLELVLTYEKNYTIIKDINKS